VVLAVGGTAVAAWRLWPEGPTPGSGRPNLILISIDTLRADHLGCYGYGRPTSPAIDALADQGVRFERVMAQSPWTLPSHVSLVTGLYPHRNGVTTTRNKVDAGVPTLGGLLARAGYVSGALTNSEWLTRRQGFDAGFSHFEYVSEFIGYNITNVGAEITDKAIRWIKENEHQPFFLLVHYYDVHSDYEPEEPYRGMFVDPAYSGDINGRTPQLVQVRRGTRRIADDEVEHLVNLYDGEIRQLDDQIGRLLQFLERRGRARDTYVVLVSDHGEEFMEHGGILHGMTMYEEVIAVPLILRGPGIPAGVTVSTLTQVVDVVPTALGLLGVECDHTLDGIDLRDHWIPGGQAPRDRVAFAEADWRNAEPDIKRMVRTPRYKLIYDRHSHVRKLYDLQDDPGEKHNVAAKQQEVTNGLMRLLRAFQSGGREGQRVEPPSEETKKRLESVGYLF